MATREDRERALILAAFEVGAHEGSEDYPLPADDDADQHIRGVLAAVDRTHPPEPDAREERDTPTVDAGLSAWFSRALDAYYRTGLLPREECIAEALSAVGPPPSSETSGSRDAALVRRVCRQYAQAVPGDVEVMALVHDFDAFEYPRAGQVTADAVQRTNAAWLKQEEASAAVYRGAVAERDAALAELAALKASSETSERAAATATTCQSCGSEKSTHDYCAECLESEAVEVRAHHAERLAANLATARAEAIEECARVCEATEPDEGDGRGPLQLANGSLLAKRIRALHTKKTCGHSDERPVIGCCDPWGVTPDNMQRFRAALASPLPRVEAEPLNHAAGCPRHDGLRCTCPKGDERPATPEQPTARVEAEPVQATSEMTPRDHQWRIAMLARAEPDLPVPSVIFQASLPDRERAATPEQPIGGLATRSPLTRSTGR